MTGSDDPIRTDYVTTSANRYPNGLFINLDPIRLALIEHSVGKWKSIALPIDEEVQSWIRHSPKNRRFHITVKRLNEGLNGAQTLDDVVRAFDEYLKTFIPGKWHRQHLDGQNVVLNILTEQRAALIPWVAEHKSHWLNEKTKAKKAGSDFSSRVALEMHPNAKGERQLVSVAEGRYNFTHARLLRSTNCRHYSEVSLKFCRDFVELANKNASGNTEKTRENFRTATSKMLRGLAGPPSDLSKDWRAHITPGQRRDSCSEANSWWVLDPEIGHPSFERWQHIFSAYLENQEQTNTTRVHKAKYLREGLLKWLRTYGDILSSPEDLTAADFVQTGGSNNLNGGLTFEEFILNQNEELMRKGEGGPEALARIAATPGQMFDYIIKNRPHLYGHSRNHVPSRLGQYPTGVTSIGERPSKTQKSILPVTIVEMALKILSEDDAAWPKQQRMCRAEVYDPEEQCWMEKYFPGPAVLLETLFSLPLRGLQARYLDSGEFDEFLVDASGNQTFNTNAKAMKGRQRGFCQIMSTALGEQAFPGFRVNTNKSSVKKAPGVEEPYDIPWHKKDLLGKLCDLRDWQTKFNPADKLLKRCQLPCDNTPDSELATEFVFLFRDAGRQRTINKFADIRTLAPLGSGKIVSLFLLLLREIQDRILSEEQREIQLVEVDEKGKISSNFTIHALRASLITHFIEAGLPVHIVSEFVAGHANLIMTLYYNKTNPATISDLLNDAAAKLEGLETDEYLTLLYEQSDDSFRDAFVFPSDHNNAFRELEPGLWHTRIDGICPVACTRCHEGMVVQQEDKKWRKRAEYTSITRNEFSCGRCRFNLTGPMFLSGQVIVHTNLVYTLREKARARSELIKRHANLLESGSKFKTTQSQKNINKLSDEIDELMVDLSFRTQRINQSIVLLQKAKGRGKGNALITGLEEADLDAVLVETSEEALTAMVSEAQFLHPEVGQGSAPSRHRLLIQKLLSENGFDDLLIRLPEDIQHEASVKLTQFLRRNVGEKGLNDLFSGITSLAEFGLINDFEKEVQNFREIKVGDGILAMIDGSTISDGVLEGLENE
ncbi:VPA1269 family protein [Leisingera aquaemixtae]|uniref:VPA1269 family protein n=1 Tax=Leisingera aquaemixtae TaxID=1396826 RepID=UPI0011AE267A|nr:VPA1269 family protein [Leisingera aquaemixtae]